MNQAPQQYQRIEGRQAPQYSYKSILSQIHRRFPVRHLTEYESIYIAIVPLEQFARRFPVAPPFYLFYQLLV